MKKYLKTDYLPHLSLLVGVAAMVLQLLLMLGKDDRGLVAGGSVLHLLAWVLTVAFLVLCAVVTIPLHGHNRYGDNYPASRLGALSSFFLAGGILVDILLNPGLTGGFLPLLRLILGGVAVPCLVFTGLCRRSGKRPAFLFHSAACLFFAVHLVSSCQIWSSEPQIETYSFALLASIALMLSAYYRASFDVGIGRRRMQLFTGLAAGCLCLAAVPGASHWPVYLAGGVWAVTNLCVLEPPRRHRRPLSPESEPEAAPEEEP